LLLCFALASSRELGFEPVLNPARSMPGMRAPSHMAYQLSCAVLSSQVNASDARGKSDASALKGVGGKLANAIKEMTTNTAISYDREGNRKKVGPFLWGI